MFDHFSTLCMIGLISCELIRAIAFTKTFSLGTKIVSVHLLNNLIYLNVVPEKLISNMYLKLEHNDYDFLVKKRFQRCN